MSNGLWRVCMAVLILGSSAGGASSLAKPPDLPVDLGADFEETASPGAITLGFDLFTGKLSLSLSLPWNFGVQTTAPGSTTPNGAAATAQASGRVNAACPGREIDGGQPTQQQVQARALFEIAERCLRNGDLDKARTCYEEVHLLAPESRSGRRAIERLGEIDNLRSKDLGVASEETGVPEARRQPD